MIILWIIVSVIVTVFAWVHWKGSYWSSKSITAPKPFLFFGNLWTFVIGKKHYAETFDDIYRKYKDASFVGFYKIFNQPAILVRDLDLIKNVMLKDFNNFIDNDFRLDEKLDPLLVHDPFAAKGTTGAWKESRSQIAPLFTPGKVKAMYSLMSQICNRMTDYINNRITDKPEFEAKDLSVNYTLEVVGTCGFGIDAETFKKDDAEIKRTAYQIFNPNEPQFLQTILPIFVPFFNSLLGIPFIPKDVDQWIRGVIGNVMSQRDTEKTRRNDLLQAVMDLRQKKAISDEVIYGHSLTFLLEGFETSSTALALAMHELAFEPNLQQSVREQVDAILDRTNGEFTEEAMNDLSFLENILLESLRLYPPLMVMTKLCTKEYEFPPQFADSKKTLTIHPGTAIVIPAYSIHHDPEIYENPEKFNPDRFLPENRQARDKFAYLSFGEGPRMCLGMLFALGMTKMALATILRNYTIRPTSKSKRPVKIMERAFLFAAKHGLWVKLEKRR